MHVTEADNTYPRHCMRSSCAASRCTHWTVRRGRVNAATRARCKTIERHSNTPHGLTLFCNEFLRVVRDWAGGVLANCTRNASVPKTLALVVETRPWLLAKCWLPRDSRDPRYFRGPDTDRDGCHILHAAHCDGSSYYMSCIAVVVSIVARPTLNLAPHQSLCLCCYCQYIPLFWGFWLLPL